MRQNSAYIIVANIMVTKIILILIVLTTLTSCSSQIKRDALNDRTEYEMRLNDVQITPELSKLIRESKNQFEKKFAIKPMVIILFIYKKDNSILVSIENRCMLYLDIKEKLISNDNFVGGTNIDGSNVLIKSSAERLYEGFIKITPKSKFNVFKFYYSNVMCFCEKIYKIQDNSFFIEETLCSDELFGN